jgi:hypothetical protein
MKFWLFFIEGTLLFIGAIGVFLAVKVWKAVPTEPTLSGGGCQQTIRAGFSVEGFSIEACHLNGSDPDAENTLLVIGTIHGDEPDGKRVIDELASSGAPPNTNIWLISDGNPDGSKLATRKNANEVDINRNFPIKWVASDPAARTYSGPSPASEPETLALMNAVEMIRPTRVVVFHQPFEQIDCPPERPAKGQAPLLFSTADVVRGRLVGMADAFAYSFLASSDKPAAAPQKDAIKKRGSVRSVPCTHNQR